jgi:hypothetical protein
MTVKICGQQAALKAAQSLAAGLLSPPPLKIAYELLEAYN